MRRLVSSWPYASIVHVVLADGVEAEVLFGRGMEVTRVVVEHARAVADVPSHSRRRTA